MTRRGRGGVLRGAIESGNCAKDGIGGSADALMRQPS